MAFFYQPKERQPIFQIPAIVVGMIVLLLGIQAWQRFVPGASGPEIMFRFGFVPARYSPGFWLGGTLLDKIIPFFTYMFLHADWNHVIVNCVWLLPFGSLAARRYGSAVFLLLFVICGVAGVVLHLALNFTSTSPVIGASASVSGLMGASFRAPSRPGEPLEPLWSKRVLLWSASWIALNIFAGLTGFGTGPGVHMVAWEAHIGGYFAGLLLVGPLDAWHRKRHPAGYPTTA